LPGLCPVLAIGGLPDHVHLLVSFTNTLSYADFMKHVKGGSSRFVTQKLKPGEWFQWQENYAVFAVSPRDIRMVTAYILNQKQRHASGNLWPEAEETYEEFDTDDPNLSEVGCTASEMACPQDTGRNAT
jgi:putative transposase